MSPRRRDVTQAIDAATTQRLLLIDARVASSVQADMLPKVLA